MPLIESQPDAVSQAYAQSLFELAEAEGGRERIEGILGELEEILELARADDAFGEFLSSRVIPVSKRHESLKGIFQERASDLTVRFLLLLNQKGRLAHLPAIAAAYDSMVQAHFGRVEVDLYTASPIEASLLSQVREQLQGALQKDVIVHPYTDPRIIGGVRIRMGDQLIDGSLATQLRRFRERLDTSGAASVRAVADRIINETD